VQAGVVVDPDDVARTETFRGKPCKILGARMRRKSHQNQAVLGAFASARPSGALSAPRGCHSPAGPLLGEQLVRANPVSVVVGDRRDDQLVGLGDVS
jgi:hypothetical protein